MFKKILTKYDLPISMRIKRDLFKLTVHICIIFSIYLFALLLLLSIYFENVSEKATQNKTFKKRIISSLNAKKYDSSLIDHGMDFENECFLDSASCFNLYRCLNLKGHDKLSETNLRTRLRVYIYDNPFRRNNHEIASTSKEFKEFIETILDSDFYESNPSRACLFVPFVDLLNENDFNSTEIETYLHDLDFWNVNGRNHFLFNLIPKFKTKLNIKFKSAIITSSKFESNTIRNGFDLTVPFFNPFTAYESSNTVELSKREYFFISTQISLNEEFLMSLRELEIGNSLKRIEIFINCLNSEAYNNLTMRCSTKDGSLHYYKNLLAKSKFCLISNYNRDSNEHLLTLFDALKFNCIPILFTNEWLLPFSEFIDWSLISIRLNQNELKDLFKILDSYSESDLEKMIEQQKFIFSKYFSSIRNITLAFLTYLESRINPEFNPTYESWNIKENEINNNPLVIPYVPENAKFTALILGLKNLEKVKYLIDYIRYNCPNLGRIIILWYGQDDQKTVEQLNSFKSNVLFIKLMKYFRNTNRFFPFEEINTEIVLHLDERMHNIQLKHINKAYDVWENFPERFIWIENENENEKTIFSPVLFSSYYNHYYLDLSNQEKKFQSNNFFEMSDCDIYLMEMLVKHLTGKPSLFFNNLQTNSTSFIVKTSRECQEFLNSLNLFSNNKNSSISLENFDYSKIIQKSIFL